MFTLDKYTIYEINDLSDQDAIDILVTGLNSIDDWGRGNKENYVYDCRDKPGNLFYVLKQGRYKDGNYWIITNSDDKKFVGSIGWNPYTEEVAVISRAIIHPEFRYANLFSVLFMHEIIKNAVSKGYKKVWAGFDPVNKAAYDMFVRGRNTADKTFRKQWEKFTALGVRTIYHTKQYVLEYND